MSTGLRIASVAFALSCEGGLVLPHAEAAYEPFTRQSPAEYPDIRVWVRPNAHPGNEGLAMLFDGRSWTMYRDGCEYLLALGAGGSAAPPLVGRTVARWNAGVTEASVYCGGDLLDRQNGRVKVLNPVHYPLDQIMLMHHLASREGLLTHAAGADIDGRGLIFPGRSGAGKSTLSCLLAGQDSIRRLSDDRMIVRKLEGGYRAYGTPWPGDAGIAVNASMPLTGICFIAHGTENRIRDLSPREAVERLLPVASIPWYDTDLLPAVLDTCDDLVASVPAYELTFAPTTEIAAFLAAFVTKG